MSDLDLDAIEARLNAATPGWSCWDGPPLALERACADIPALLAEVRRLREALEDIVRTAPLMGERWAYEVARRALTPEAS